MGLQVFLALLAALLVREEAFQTQRGRLLRRAVREEGIPDEVPPEREGIQSGMRNKLMEEARSLGDEQTPISAGFGNPYLLAIIVILGLGVASYFQLGLDKVKSAKPSDAGDQDLGA